MALVKDHMSTRVFTASPETPLPRVAHVMWDKDCGFVPIVDPETSALAGVLTDRDICMAAYTQGRPLHEIETREVMTGRVVSCLADDDVLSAEQLMRKYQVRRLPVTDAAGRLVGVLSLNDLALHACDAGKTKELAQVARTLGEICRHRLPAARRETAGATG